MRLYSCLFRSFHTVLIVVPLLAVPANVFGGEKAAPEPFLVMVDAPWRITPAKPFGLRITYSVLPNSTGQPVTKTVMHIVTDKSADVTYKPTELDLVPNSSGKIAATVNRTESGLAEILIASSHYHNVRLSVDGGFRGRVTWRTTQSLESETSQWSTLDFVDNMDRPLSLDAPIKLRVGTGHALIRRKPNDAWSDHIDIDVPKGASDTGPFELMPDTLAASHGALQVRGFLNDESQVLFDHVLPFEIVPPIWVRIGITILGALIYSMYAMSRTYSGRLFSELSKALGSGTFAGVLAWALADWNVLGIRIDTSHLTGYFVLGLVTSYAGVEPILARLIARNERRSATRAPAEIATGQTVASSEGS